MARFSRFTSLGALVALMSSTGFAQPAPEFVSSVKPSDSADRRVMFNYGANQITGSNVTVKRLMQVAYGGLKDFQIVGGPAWAGSDLYDIKAKPETPADPEKVRLILQSLLADRFHLLVRRETKD